MRFTIISRKLAARSQRNGLTSFQTSGITLVSFGLELKPDEPEEEGMVDQVYAEAAKCPLQGKRSAELSSEIARRVVVAEACNRVFLAPRQG